MGCVLPVALTCLLENTTVACTKKKDIDHPQGSVMSDNAAATIPLLAWTTHPRVTEMINSGSYNGCGGNSLYKQVKDILSGDSDKEGAHFVRKKSGGNYFVE